MFLINSRLGHFSASCSECKHYYRNPFSRSYGVILPSSLTMNHSSTFGFSPRLPVSVYGTGSLYLTLRGFSWKQDYNHYPRSRSLVVLSTFSMTSGFTYSSFTYSVQRAIPSARGSFTSPSPHRSISWYWNINQLSIDYPLRVRLRTRLTHG